MPVDDNPEDYLKIAVRAWTDNRKVISEKPPSQIPSRLLVIDTETGTDEFQSLKFGSAQLFFLNQANGAVTGGRSKAEVLFYADDLPESDPDGYHILVTYCHKHHLELLSKSEFMIKWVHAQCVPRINANGKHAGTATLTGLNLIFDMSRLAYSHGKGHGRNKGAFSFVMFPRYDDGGENTFKPRFICNSLDSKKAIMHWGSAWKGHKWEDERKPDTGSFLDVRQLIWGLTNKAVSLKSGCKLYDLPEKYSKTYAEQHGVITPEYVAYNRQDVTATGQLAIAALKDYSQHPVNINAEKIFSPASVSKGYLRQMGITPMLSRETVPQDNRLLGNITSTFYGARAEAHIRNVPVPVTVNDFTSMYCLVNVLLDHWKHITAETVRVVDITESFKKWLKTVTVDTVLDKTQWPSFTGFVQIQPDGDILPVRAQYTSEPGYNVGINKLHSAQPFWYSIPDIIASVLLTGKIPVIHKATKFVPSDQKIGSLKPIKLMNKVTVDPSQEDFFRAVTEQRATLKRQRTCDGSERCTCIECKAIEALKVNGNSGSYGIYVEMLRQDTPKPVQTTVYGMREESWESAVNAVETAQEFCYPPVGSVITAGARLLLAVLERLVTDEGGTWLFCDTDSMAVVCDRNGSLIPCPGGQHKTLDNQEAIKAVTPEIMEAIRAKINKLNPFNPSAVPSILKDETSKSNASDQVYGFAISAKRYTLFTYVNNRPVIPEEIDGKRSYKEHGLGLYLNPTNPDLAPKNRQWIRETWQYILDDNHQLEPPFPDWHTKPALGRVSLSSPHVMTVLKDYNSGKDYKDQVKPFGFVHMVSNKRNLFTQDRKARRFISPYTQYPDEWLNQEWYDLHKPGTSPVRITTGNSNGSNVQVRCMRDVIWEYIAHPESKSQILSGGLSGILARRTVRVNSIIHIGKESNNLEEVQNHQHTSIDDFYTQYDTEDANTEYAVSCNIAVVLKAYADISHREIARMVNDESKQIHKQIMRESTPKTRNRAKLTDDEKFMYPDMEKVYGTPVVIDHETVTSFFKGNPIRPENTAAIERTAAKHIANTLGYTYKIGYDKHFKMIHPELVLAKWRENGCKTETDLINTRLAESGSRIRIVG